MSEEKISYEEAIQVIKGNYPSKHSFPRLCQALDICLDLLKEKVDNLIEK
jgi:hypothetical protein